MTASWLLRVPASVLVPEVVPVALPAPGPLPKFQLMSLFMLTLRPVFMPAAAAAATLPPGATVGFSL